ncbi:MAG: SAM-dependent methyltransferase [Mariniphaga sp.]
MAELYLVPSMMGGSDWQQVLPAAVGRVLSDTRYFIVENIRTARRFMKLVNPEIDIDRLTFFELNKHTDATVVPGYLQPLEEGFPVAVISEAGCPGVADPGAEVVKIAHQKNIRVVPLTGPSSVILALMASGFNGQQFAFRGYLPVHSGERSREILNLESMVKKTGQTQIFIETPYRNDALVKDLLKTCSANTLICIAVNLTTDDEYIATKTAGQWKKCVPQLHKKPAVFLLGR